MQEKMWWEQYPWRMVQTNLREIDMNHMDAEQFSKELQAYHATVVTLNAAGILASYDTELPFQPKSAYLTGDSLKEMVDACHRKGIRVIARCDFSKIRYEVYEKHPDWAYRTESGDILNYNGFVQTCVNSPYQSEKVLEIVEELFKTHPFDGIFLNMSGLFVVDYDMKVYGPCHCENCRKKYEEQYHEPLPGELDRRSPSLMKYMGFMSACSEKNRRKLYAKVKSINPQIAVNGFDYQRTECNQDISRPANVSQAPYQARRLVGPELTGVCDDASASYVGFQYRHTSVSPWLLEMRQWQNLANGAGTSLYILGTLGGHKDRSGIEASEPAFRFFAEHEALYRNLRPAAKAVLVDLPGMGNMNPEVSGWMKVLTGSHIPFVQCQLKELNEQVLSGKTLVVLPNAEGISDEQAALLDLFAEGGGTVLAAGKTGYALPNRRPRPENALHCLGVNGILETRKGLKSTLFELTEADLQHLSECRTRKISNIIPGKEVVIPEVADPERTECFLKLLPEQTYGPPEIAYPRAFSDLPGLYRTRYGAGYGVYIPWLPGTFYEGEGIYNTYAFMQDVLLGLCNAESAAPSVNPMCEITVMENEAGRLIQLVNTSGAFEKSFFPPVPMENLVLTGLLPAEYTEMKAINGGTAEVIEQDGCAGIRLDRLNMFEAIQIYR